jgi:hypothetical protein
MSTKTYVFEDNQIVHLKLNYPKRYSSWQWDINSDNNINDNDVYTNFRSFYPGYFHCHGIFSNNLKSDYISSRIIIKVPEYYTEIVPDDISSYTDMYRNTYYPGDSYSVYLPLGDNINYLNLKHRCETKLEEAILLTDDESLSKIYKGNNIYKHNTSKYKYFYNIDIKYLPYSYYQKGIDFFSFRRYSGDLNLNNNIIYDSINKKMLDIDVNEVTGTNKSLKLETFKRTDWKKFDYLKYYHSQNIEIQFSRWDILEIKEDNEEEFLKSINRKGFIFYSNVDILNSKKYIIRPIFYLTKIGT